MSSYIKLSELCKTITDGSHFSPKPVFSGYPMLSVKDMRENGFDYSNCNYISSEDYQILLKNGCVPVKNDVLIAKDGSYLKHIFVVDENKEEAILSSIGILRPDLTKINPFYLKYYLSSDFVKEQVSRKYVSGSALPRIILKNFKDIDIPYVSLKRQEEIISLLKNIDNKIENNNKTIKTLESLAKTIYDYWFLQFEFPNEEGKPYKSSGGKMVWNEELKREIPEGWDVSSLYSIANFINGAACQKFRPLNNEDYLPVIKITEMHNGITDNTEQASVNIPDKYKIKDGDILFSWSATLETMIWNGGKGALNQHIFKVVPILYPKYYVFLQLNAYIINFIKMAETRKTTMGHITSDHLKQSRIVIPPLELCSSFENKVKNMFESITNNYKQNQQFASLRDWLLPMLMNGQVTFKEDTHE